MSITERFMAYAADFEKTLAGDDWSRLAPYFSEDAVYRIESHQASAPRTLRTAPSAG